VAKQSFSAFLTTNREQFQKRVQERVRQLSARYPALGIKLDGLSIHDLHPPQEVVPAYHDVTSAMETRDRRINEAQAEATKRTAAAQAEANQRVRQAEAAENQTVKMAAADRDSFLARWKVRTQHAVPDERGRSSEDLSDEKRTEQRQLYAILTDFRLFWNAFSQALTGREKILIDSDHVSGHRRLLLIDPERFRPPPSILNGPASEPSTKSAETKDRRE
jgi:Cu+-exporting ATPase